MMDIGSRSHDHTNTQGGLTPNRPARTKPLMMRDNRSGLGIERMLTKVDEFGQVSFVSFDRSLRI